MQRRDMTPADFARRLEVGNSTVTMWVRGERIPTPASCRKIAAALDIADDVVLVAAGHRDPDYEVDPDSPPERFRAMMQRIRWTPERESLVEGMLRQMLEFDRSQDKA